MRRIRVAVFNLSKATSYRFQHNGVPIGDRQGSECASCSGGIRLFLWLNNNRLGYSITSDDEDVLLTEDFIGESS